MSDPQLDIFEESVKDNCTEEQKKFIEHNPKGDSVILSATAGSGKTFSCVQRLKFLLQKGIDPSRIIFFSFTKAATEELQARVGRDDIKITTIHAFCMGLLSKMGKYRQIATFYEFIEWFKQKYKPSNSSSKEAKRDFYDTVSSLYEDSEVISSSISAYKLQTADKIKCKLPDFYFQYCDFLKQTKTRDFSDMLIEVRDLLKEDKWLKMFRNKYDYIFVDEYQDTSTIQFQILLALNAAYYYLIGDVNQSIYSYSGSNCRMIESMLSNRRKTIKMPLSINFRSDINIIENSNKYSSLKAVPSSKKDGFIQRSVMLKTDDLVKLLNTGEEVVVLVRTNSVIKKLELEFLKKKIPMRYFNYITKTDLKNWKKGEKSTYLSDKIEELKSSFSNENEILSFIEEHSESKNFITTIHKSKGREFDNCVVVNSIAPEILEENGFLKKLNKKQLERISFSFIDKGEVIVDEEAKNIHYVGITRSKHGLYFMIYDY